MKPERGFVEDNQYGSDSFWNLSVTGVPLPIHLAFKQGGIGKEFFPWVRRIFRSGHIGTVR
jgi:hypothetical protein